MRKSKKTYIMTNSIYGLYEATLPLAGMENLIMGVTLMVLCLARKYDHPHSRSGLLFLALAMLVMGVVNLTEHVVGIGGTREMYYAVLIFTASIELFLCFMAYVSFLDKTFVTRRRMLSELGMIVVFTLLPMLFLNSQHSHIVVSLFAVSIIFYVVKLISNVWVYARYVRKAKQRIENYHSDDSAGLLVWVNRTFGITLAIGVFAIFAPMGSPFLLAFYNIFLIFAFFFIYVMVIRNIHLFDGSMSYVNDDLVGQEGSIARGNADNNFSLSGFLSGKRLEIYKQWIEQKGYTEVGITADNIARMLNTSQNRLSAYLNGELGMNYYEWIARLRIGEAMRLLSQEPDTSIVDIAIRVGIENRSNFGRAFKWITGISPAEYRKKNITTVN